MVVNSRPFEELVMAAWCSINITYAPTGYSQNYKRDVHVHSHPAEAQFVRDSLADSLAKIHVNHPQAQENQLGQNNLRVQMAADPGANYRNI
jgi:hypothetical protein